MHAASRAAAGAGASTSGWARCRAPVPALHPAGQHLGFGSAGRSWQLPQQRHARWVARSSEECAAMLQQANSKYSSKDLMGALNLYEAALKQDGISTRQRQEALYGATAVHATFGDVELAQITLREGIKQGLDFEQAINDPDMVDMVASQQILIQLKRFNQSAQQAAARSRRQQQQAQPVPAAAGAGGSSRARTRPASSSPLDQDLGSILGTPDSDTAAIDTSVGAIIKRVVLVVLAAVGLGTALFYLGLETLFPRY